MSAFDAVDGSPTTVQPAWAEDDGGEPLDPQVLQFFAKIPACLVGSEACGAAHYWGRELRKLGHDARMMPPSFVKPYVKRQNDAADAEAICEAVTRPTMRSVEIKSGEQQSIMALHRSG